MFLVKEISTPFKSFVSVVKDKSITFSGPLGKEFSPKTFVKSMMEMSDWATLVLTVILVCV